MEIYLQVLENPLSCKYASSDFVGYTPSSDSYGLMFTWHRQVRREFTSDDSGECYEHIVEDEFFLL